MANQLTYKGTSFSVGDRIRVSQKIKESGKERSQSFEGMLIAIKGFGDNRSITVRRIGVQQIGIERIFPLGASYMDKIEVVKKGGAGSRHAKLYYVRTKPKRDIEKIYSRNTQKNTTSEVKKKK